jgi:hypothetical protein
MRLAHIKNFMPLAATRHASPKNQCLHAGKPVNKLAAVSRYVIKRRRNIQVAHADLQSGIFIYNLPSRSLLFFLLLLYLYPQSADLHPPLVLV